MLYADPDDQYHNRANDELNKIQTQGKQILVLYPILMEAYTLIVRYLDIEYAHSWLDSITTGTGLINPTGDDHLDSTNKVKVYKDQQITLSDATVAVVADNLNVPIWTFDSDFDVMRTDVWRL